MTTLEWVGTAGLMCTIATGAYFIIMNAVDGKIERAMNKLKEEKIQELIRQNERLMAKNEMLKDGINKLK
jgi:hypothetical protein